MTINLAALDTAAASETPYDLELTHPTTKKPLGLFIQVAGSNSTALRQLDAKRRNEALKRSFEADRGVKHDATTAEEIDAEAVKILATATVGWYEKQEKGKRIEGLPFGEQRLMFSAEEAEKLYSNPGFKWIANQVDKAVYDLGNFIKG